jgi:uncharacterized protein involved in response to NO
VVREVVIGRNWRNLAPLALVTLLAVGKIAFHAEVLTEGAAGAGPRIGVAALVASIVLIGGRITPSFTHNWLMRVGSPRLPARFGILEKLAMLTTGSALLLWIAIPVASITALLFLGAAGLLALRLARWEGMRVWREPLLLVLHAGYAFVPVGFLLGAISILWPAALTGSVKENDALHGLNTAGFLYWRYGMQEAALQGESVFGLAGLLGGSGALLSRHGPGT